MPRGKGRGIPASELDASTREHLGIKLGPNSPLLQGVAGARKSSDRKRGGMQKEAQLETTHTWYRQMGLAEIHQHHPATVGPPGRMRYKEGSAPPDFSGWALLPIDAHTSAGQLWAPVPVLFDAKGVSRRGTYKHDVDQLHQLRALLSFARDVSYRVAVPLLAAVRPRSFLLLIEANRGQALVVEDPKALGRLEDGDELAIYDRGRPLWPHVEYDPHTAARWDWRAVLMRTAAAPAPASQTQ